MQSPSPCSLVIGATGQVGAALVAVLGPQVLAAGRTATDSVPLAIDLSAIAANPSLAKDHLAPLDLDAIYCTAGATDVERCETDLGWADAVNHRGPAALAAAALARSLPFVFFSTDYVFNGAPTHPGPYAEDAPTHPLSVYGRTKLLGEQAVLAAHPDALILRTTTVFGPDRQRKNFLYTLTRLLTSGQQMRVPTDQFSNPTYNADLAAAAITLVERRTTGIVHVAGPDLLSRYDFARLAAKLLGLDASLINPVPTSTLQQRAARPLHSGLCTEKLTALLGHSPMRSTRDAILAWRDSNPGTAAA